MENEWILFTALAIGVPLFVAGIFFLALKSVRLAVSNERKALEGEGIVLETGLRWITIRYRHFRAPGFYRGIGISRMYTAIFLTRQHLVLTLGSFRNFVRIKRSDLNRFTVGLANDGALVLDGIDLPGSTGVIQYRVQLSDARVWEKALREAGAIAKEF